MSTRTEAYTYDALNRLKTVDYGDGLTQAYSFDAMGNRLQKTDSTAGTTNSTYDAANRLTATTGTGASTYTFDADGNTLTGGTRTNTWDSQNRLVSCTFNGTTSTFKYGADGLRRQATVNGIITDYVYDGSTLIREGHASGGTLTTVTATYLTGPRGPEYRRDDTQTELDSQGRTVSKTRWYVYDGLGSVVGEMDPNGSLTSSPKYDVYGLVRSNSGTASSKMGFVGGLGHLSEANTGLIYMKARYYDPTQGRFASEDPVKDGVNWFIYASDNPINSVDADGHMSVEALIVAFLLYLAHIASEGFRKGLFGDTQKLIEEKTKAFKDTLKADAKRLLKKAGIEFGQAELDGSVDDTEALEAKEDMEAKNDLATSAVESVEEGQLDVEVEIIEESAEEGLN